MNPLEALNNFLAFEDIKRNYNIWGNIISLPESTKIGAFCDIGEPDIGDNCKIQCLVSIPPGWKIGNDVFIGPGVHFVNDKELNMKRELIGGVVEDYVKIGAGAIILPVRLGKGSRIGAGAVVTKDVEPYKTVVGNPAHII